MRRPDPRRPGWPEHPRAREFRKTQIEADPTKAPPSTRRAGSNPSHSDAQSPQRRLLDIVAQIRSRIYCKILLATACLTMSLRCLHPTKPARPARVAVRDRRLPQGPSGGAAVGHVPIAAGLESWGRGQSLGPAIWATVPPDQVGFATPESAFVGD